MSDPIDQLENVPDEKLAEKTRQVIDRLRSIELYAELNALKQTVEALRASAEDVNKTATNLAGTYLQKYSISRKRERILRMPTWGWITLIVGIITVGLIFIFG